jgi:hypothetical protein
VHDYFEILGVARDARPTEIRRACGRRVHASHPDIRDGDAVPGAQAAALRLPQRPSSLGPDDAAIDFVDAATLVDAMRLSFFASNSRPADGDAFF